MNTAQKAQILSSLSMVSDKTFAGWAIALFCENAHLKTDAEVRTCVLDIQSQIKDNRKGMERVLGSQFEFLSRVKFQSRLQPA